MNLKITSDTVYYDDRGVVTIPLSIEKYGARSSIFIKKKAFSQIIDYKISPLTYELKPDKPLLYKDTLVRDKDFIHKIERKNKYRNLIAKLKLRVGNLNEIELKDSLCQYNMSFEIHDISMLEIDTTVTIRLFYNMSKCDGSYHSGDCEKGYFYSLSYFGKHIRGYLKRKRDNVLTGVFRSNEVVLLPLNSKE
jgi:hypothetical protein